MDEGISLDEACATGLIGTEEDFALNCNPDGTAKEYAETTTFTIKGTDMSFTIQNTHLQIAGVLVLLFVGYIISRIIKSIKRRRKAPNIFVK